MEANKQKYNNIENNIHLDQDEELVFTDTLETGKNEMQVPLELMAVDLTNKNENQSSNIANQKIKSEQRKVMVPSNRMKPLKDNWTTIVKALVEHMKIQVRMNTKGKCIEIRTCDKTEDISAMQKSEEFLKAFMCGFDLQDAIAMLRLEDLYLETFEIKDVKALSGDHLSRCIGRICGEKGKTKNAIENATRTRIIVQDAKISLLGSSSNIALARNSICSLILGAPPGKVYASLRIIGKRVNEKI